jgi:hypothetical protein
VIGLAKRNDAYMRFAVRNFAVSNSASVVSVIYALCKDPQTVEEEWVLFTEKQKATIASFLKFMVLEVGGACPKFCVRGIS